MDSYPPRPLPVRPRPKPIADMTEQELTELLTKSRSYGDLIPGLIEYVFRQDREIKALKDQLGRQQTKPAKKFGRAKTDYYVDGILLTDEYIAHYVEGNYFTITELERFVGAKPLQALQRKAKKGGIRSWKLLDPPCRSGASRCSTLLPRKLSKTACKKS